MKWINIAVVSLVVACAWGSLAASELTVRERHVVSVPEAHQAVAVDATSFYAIASRTIARYEKGTSKLLASWSAPAGSAILHLNSGVVVDGRLYCANSNWPRTPLKNSVEIFDAEALQHLESLPFSETEGAINWIERHRGSWWIVFAFYGDAEVRRTKLMRYDDRWNQTGEWTFPESVIQRFLPNSNSGGAFGPNGRLFVTGHDHAELYVLDVAADGGELSHVATVAAPIAGQGIAWDRSDIGTLLGIVRSRHEVVTMRLSHTVEYTDLRRPVEWIRDQSNPVLLPRPGEFDATRCMNPWVVRDADTYRLFYSGGDKNGKQRIGVATASVGDITNWTRTGPLFETGAAGSFDAQWCVLPHVVRMQDNRWHLYYTGNAGSGSGLSAFPGLGLATSDDGITWTRHGDRPVLARSGEHGDPDAIGVAGGSVLQVPQADGPPQWRFYYTGCRRPDRLTRSINRRRSAWRCPRMASTGRNREPSCFVILTAIMKTLASPAPSCIWNPTACFACGTRPSARDTASTRFAMLNRRTEFTGVAVVNRKPIFSYRQPAVVGSSRWSSIQRSFAKAIIFACSIAETVTVVRVSGQPYQNERACWRSSSLLSRNGKNFNANLLNIDRVFHRSNDVGGEYVCSGRDFRRGE